MIRTFLSALLCMTSICAGISSKKPEDIKILMLIIASDDMSVYQEEQEIWRSYMHSCPEHVEVYFIKGDPALRKSFVIKGDIIYAKTKEKLFPGILNKTVFSLRAFLPRLQGEFDYVIRTNLSSFYVLPRLVEFVKTLPRKKCYMGPVFSAESVYHDLLWVGGHGILMSSDLACKIARNDALIDCRMRLQDDVVIAWFLKKILGITPIRQDSLNISSIDSWENVRDSIPEHIFLFRTKCAEHLRMTDELFIQHSLLKMFYN